MNGIESTRINENGTGLNGDHRRLTAGKIVRIIGWVMAGVVLACLFALIFGLIVKWLWGVTLTPLFNLPQPTYWQAVGLILLAKLLFGGIGHHHREANHPFGPKRWHHPFDTYSRKSYTSSGGKDSAVGQGE